MPNVSELGEFQSDPATVRGIDWYLIVERRGDLLGVYLRVPSEIIPGTPGTIKTSNTYDVEATFELLPFGRNVEPMKRSLDNSGYSAYFKWGMAKKGCRDFIRWDDFMDESKRFIVHDSAKFIVEFTVAEPISILDRPNPTLA